MAVFELLYRDYGDHFDLELFLHINNTLAWVINEHSSIQKVCTRVTHLAHIIAATSRDLSVTARYSLAISSTLSTVRRVREPDSAETSSRERSNGIRTRMESQRSRT